MVENSWLWKSILSLLCLIPAWLSISFFEKNFQIRGEVTMVWYMFGVFMGSAVLLRAMNIMHAKDFFPSTAHLIILVVGLTVGTLANVFLFSAIPQAPNPGLPVAIAGTASIFVFLISAGLAALLPAYFSRVALDAYRAGGIALTLVGLILIVWKR